MTAVNMYGNYNAMNLCKRKVVLVVSALSLSGK